MNWQQTLTRMVNFVSFPPLSSATADGLLAAGGDLSLDTLVSAYSQGIFPWFNEDQPILWWSPEPRLVLYPAELKISRSLKKTLLKNKLQISCDQAFDEVVRGCARRGRDLRETKTVTTATWITESMYNAYMRLFENGYAHSIEVWQESNLVGGLYGVVLGKVFFGESMFSKVNDASKVALVALCKHLQKNNFKVIDCQVASAHLSSLGASEISRIEFKRHLQHININQPSSDFAADFEFDTAEGAYFG